MRTVLADDNAEVRAALHLLLEEMGWTDIVEAANAEETIATVEAAPVGVILLDWELPGCGRSAGNGYELTRELKQKAPESRIIAMSARPEARRQALAAGCSEFISRNEPPDRLLAILGNREGST